MNKAVTELFSMYRDLSTDLLTWILHNCFCPYTLRLTQCPWPQQPLFRSRTRARSAPVTSHRTALKTLVRTLTGVTVGNLLSGSPCFYACGSSQF